ncbi:MAG TPA: phosphoribosylformylglycinamidine synthase subunit PurS [Candidatus Limnocylindrales bacterium]
MSDTPRAFRFAVNVTPKPGILDPQGRAIEGSLAHLGIEGVSAIRVGRRVELTVTAADREAASEIVDRLAGELLANPLIEAYAVEEYTSPATLSGAPTSTEAFVRPGPAAASADVPESGAAS